MKVLLTFIFCACYSKNNMYVFEEGAFKILYYNPFILQSVNPGMLKCPD